MCSLPMILGVPRCVEASLQSLPLLSHDTSLSVRLTSDPLPVPIWPYLITALTLFANKVMFLGIWA